MTTINFTKFLFLILCIASSSITLAYPPGSVYMCEISNGRFVSADRPIPQCLEKEQRVFSPSGVSIAVIPPASVTRAKEERLAQEQEARRARAEIESRKEQLLFIYPNSTVHDEKRQQNLAPLLEKLAMSNQQIAFLQKQLLELKEAASANPSLDAPNDREMKIQSDISVQEDIASTLRYQIKVITAQYDEEKAFLSEFWKN